MSFRNFTIFDNLDSKLCKCYYKGDIRKFNFYTSVRTVLCYLNKLCCFLRLSWNFFLGFSDLLNNEMTNNLHVWLCNSVTVLCVTQDVSSFLYINIFQSAPNLVQIFLNAIPVEGFLFFFFEFSIYTVSIDFFSFLV